jgi:hypothetical protein
MLFKSSKTGTDGFTKTLAHGIHTASVGNLFQFMEKQGIKKHMPGLDFEALPS